MSFPRFLGVLSVIIFGTILGASFLKRQNNPSPSLKVDEIVTIEAPGNQEGLTVLLEQTIPEEEVAQSQINAREKRQEETLEEVDRLNELFSVTGKKSPIVQTITYKSSVPWLKGRSAWLCDYATHYKTSRHFIARSLNGKPDYEKQDIANGDRFNVLNPDLDIRFHLLVDLTTSRMWFSYQEGESEKHHLLKTYKVGLGRPDEYSASGYLTPTGTYSLGDRVATFKPKKIALHQGERKEMIQVFGTRWIPFNEEIEGCSEPAKGFGIHGLPLVKNDEGVIEENLDSIGKFESDGCIRLKTADVEELFAIIITKPTQIELVKDVQENSKLKMYE
ncbi:MAG: L,D-transpeptidase [Waddliaceae bacterium]